MNCRDNIERDYLQPKPHQRYTAGGIQSLLVWNMAFDALLDKFNKGPIKTKEFADDAALEIKGPEIPSLIDKGQEAISIATSFGRERGLEFGAEKTIVVMFTRRRFNPTQVH